MAIRNSSEVNLSVDMRGSAAHELPSADTPFRILVAANFKGERPPSPSYIPVLVDRDNLEDVMANWAPTLNLGSVEGEPVALRFRELEDFHPDRIYAQSTFFQRLRDLKEELEDPSRFRQAMAKAERPAAPRAEAPLLSTGSLLDQMLEESGPEVVERQVDPMEAFLARVTAPYVTPGKTPEQKQMLEKLEEAISEQMRAVLHHPRFQALEAAWKGLDLLVRRLETGVALKIHMMDLSREELVGDVSAGDNLRNTRWFDLIVRKTQNAQPWGAVVADYMFGPDAADIDVLVRLAMIAGQSRTPFLTGAVPKVAGCQKVSELADPGDWAAPEEGWELLRELPEARYLLMALPRFLLRLPYGEETSSTESVKLEEMPGRPIHERYLWGSPAFACGWALGNAFEDEGWGLVAGRHHDLEGVPLHVAKYGGQYEPTACAEVFLSENAINAIYGRGITPLISMRGGDTVRMLRLQSVAKNGSMLGGRWE